jgi:hypothetical protein
MHLLDFIAQWEPADGGVRQDQLDIRVKGFAGSPANIVALKEASKKPLNLS